MNDLVSGNVCKLYVKKKKGISAVPVSQLVLPVGVRGLTVKGKEPNPEPGSIIGDGRHPIQRQ